MSGMGSSTMSMASSSMSGMHSASMSMVSPSMSGMDSSSMSMSMSGNSTSMKKRMMMYYYIYTDAWGTILFKSWYPETWAEMLGSCLAVALFAALYEGLKIGRLLLMKKMARSGTTEGDVCQCPCDNQSSASYNVSTQSAVVSSGGGYWKSKRRHPIISLSHFIQTLLHFVQLWMGLLLMLVIMTFNVYLCLAVATGGAIGYYCFAWAVESSNVVTGRGKQSGTENDVTAGYCH